jgi:hypothetical protein
MTKHGHSKKGAGKGPAPGQRNRFGGSGGKASGFPAGAFARIREGQDLVAFATPGPRPVARLYVEALEVFEAKKLDPRFLVIVVAESHTATQFQAYEVAFQKFASFLHRAKLVDKERPYWTFQLKDRGLIFPDGSRLELKKLEKRH